MSAGDGGCALSPLGALKGYLGAWIAYPIAERFEKRDVRTKVHELQSYYSLPFATRLLQAKAKFIETVKFAGEQVPYYRDLFQARGFVPDKLRRDLRYLEDLPYLTKDIIREQGDRLLSRSLDGIQCQRCKTGGSTGPSCVIYMDQEATDYSSAVIKHCREQIGKMKHMSELHFATQFPDAFPLRDRLREHCKCFAMNRSNIFFDRLDAAGLEKIRLALSRRQPYLVHGAPSTLYALACYVEQTHGGGKAFEVFESSGELLAPYMRETITRVFQCRVIDRYGLAEFGVIAYELGPRPDGLQVLESEGWPELLPMEGSDSEQELVFTGFRNRLMPLLRYRTGDLARLEEKPDGFFLVELVGRIHDAVPIHGLPHSSQYIQDVLDRVGGIQEFQIDLRFSPPVLRLVPEVGVKENQILTRLNGWWQDSFEMRFVQHDDLVRIGHRSKFNHVVRE
jgi:phenylacetate-CoA ligase